MKQLKWITWSILWMLALLPALPTTAATTDETRSNPAPSNQNPYNQNLKGIIDARINCMINGIFFYRGYTSPASRKVEEFLPEDAESRLTQQRIPLQTADIRSLYEDLEEKLDDADIRIADIRTAGDISGATLLPTITLEIEIRELDHMFVDLTPGGKKEETKEKPKEEPKEESKEKSKEKGKETDEDEIADDTLYVVMVRVTADRWMSSWSGPRNTRAPVLTWRQEQFIAARKVDLKESVSRTAGLLTDGFIVQWRAANTEVPSETTPANTDSQTSKI